MANVTRFDPFLDVDDFLRGFHLTPIRRASDVDPKMKIEVQEDDKAYTVHAELPGVKKENIKINIDGNQVSISAEVKRESEKKEEGRIVHSERYYGNVYRSFTLDSAIDEAKSSASYKDGVLEMVLPKKNGGGPTKLKVS
jgi:HSP20 family protein